MKRAHLTAFMLTISICMAQAADVNITGKVIRSGGTALKDVTVYLAKMPEVTAKTDADGKFTLTSTRVNKGVNFRVTDQLHFTISGKDLIFSSSSGNINGNVSVFSGNGRQIFTKDFNNLNPLTQRITLGAFTPGLNVLKVTANSSVYTCTLLQEGQNLYLKKSGTASNQSFKIASSLADAVSDTLVAKKSGFTDKKTPITSYSLSDVNISMDSAVTAPCDYKSLKEAAEKCGTHPMLMGMAVSPSDLKSKVTADFNYVTAQNEMKWQSTEPNEGKFTFSSGDAIVNWAQQNNIKVKGHCLVWHSQLANWVSGLTGRDRVLAVMKNHIDSLMGHWGNKVYAWDVVNEAIYTDSDEGIGNAGYRKSVFYNQIGEDYIELAFKYAREYADSHNMKDMKLYYNDYSIDADNDKVKFLKTVAKGWVEKGVPVDGIGFQMHIGPPNNICTAESVKNNMQYFADLGFEVLISEWDINLCGNLITKEQQLKLYHDITQVCVNQPKCTAITIWGYNDSESWLNSWSTAKCNGQNSQSLLFSNDQKKDTYNQVLNALNCK